MASTEQNNVFALVDRPARSVESATPSLDFRNSPNIIESYRNTFGDGKSFELSQLPILPHKAYLLPAHKQIKSKVENSLRNISKYEAIIMLAADKYEISPNLLKALLIQESNGIWYARSSAKALGIAQFIPSTWNDVNNGQNKKMNYTNPLNPYQAIHASAQYLRDQLGPCNGNKDAALASYNQGRGMVRQKDNRWRIRDWKGQNVETTETLDYVASIRIIEQYLDDNYPLGEPAQWDNNNGKYSWKATGKDAEKLADAKDNEPNIDKQNMGGENKKPDDYFNDTNFIEKNRGFIKTMQSLTPQELAVISPAHPEIYEFTESVGNRQAADAPRPTQSTKQEQEKFQISEFGREILRRANMTSEEIDALEGPVDLESNPNILRAHVKTIEKGRQDKSDRIKANKKKGKDEEKEQPGYDERYSNLFPDERDQGKYRVEDIDIFEWLQRGYSQSNPKEYKSTNEEPEGKVLKNAIRVAIAVPKRLKKIDPDKANEQIEKAQKFLDKVDGGQNLVAEVMYIDDDRLNDKVQILPINTKGQAMFSHHDGVLWANPSALVDGVAVSALGTAGLITGAVSNPLGWAAIGAGVVGGAYSMLDNYAYNHNWWGISDKYQVPITIDHAFQQSLHDSEFDYDNAKDVYNMFEKIQPGEEVGHRTSNYGWGTKHYVGESALKKIKDMAGQSISLERDTKERFEKSDNPPPPKQQTPATDTQKQKEPTQEDIQQQQRIREQEEKDRKKREEENDERLTKMFYAMLKFR